MCIASSAALRGIALFSTSVSANEIASSVIESSGIY